MLNVTFYSVQYSIEVIVCPLPHTVCPDVQIRSSPIFPSFVQKVATTIFGLKQVFSKQPKIPQIIGLLCETFIQRDGIYREHLRTLSTHFKTNTKTIVIYRVLGCCVLLKIKI